MLNVNKCKDGSQTGRESNVDDDMHGLKLGDDTTNNHYHQQASGLAKLAGPLLIAGSLLGTGGIGAAAYVGAKLIDKMGQPTQTIEPIDNQLSIEFIGGEE